MISGFTLPGGPCLRWVGGQLLRGTLQSRHAEVNHEREAAARQTISPSSTHEDARTACAISSVSMGKHGKLSIDVPATRDECAAVTFDVRQGAEAVVLQLEDPVGMIERTRDAPAASAEAWAARPEGRVGSWLAVLVQGRARLVRLQVLEQPSKCRLVAIVVLPLSEIGDEIFANLTRRVLPGVGIKAFPVAQQVKPTRLTGNNMRRRSRGSRFLALAISVRTHSLFMLCSERISSKRS